MVTIYFSAFTLHKGNTKVVLFSFVLPPDESKTKQVIMIPSFLMIRYPGIPLYHLMIDQDVILNRETF